MKAGRRVEFKDDLVVVTKGREVVYKGIEDYEPMSGEPWRFVVTTKGGKGHYELDGYKKFVIDCD